jgi:di/tripeptidase
VERAEKANAEALALLESIVAAKAKVDDLLPACVARLEALSARRSQAVRAVEQISGMYADTAWADVADNVSKADEGLARVRTLLAETQVAADHSRQHYFRAVALVDEAVKEENERWKNNGTITVDPKVIGYRPVGETPPESPIVVTAQGAVRAVGLRPMLVSGATDANAAMWLKIPGITIGGGGSAKDAHSLAESFDSKDSYKGVQYAILLVTSLAQ